MVGYWSCFLLCWVTSRFFCILTSAFFIVWLVVQSLWYFLYMFSDSSVLLSNVISSGVISFLLVISICNLVDIPLYSTVTHVFPMNSISFLFTSRYLSFFGLISLITCILWSYGMMVTGEPVSMMNFCVFSVYFYFDTLIVLVFG